MTSRFRSNWAKEGPKSTSPTFVSAASKNRSHNDDVNDEDDNDRRRDNFDDFTIDNKPHKQNKNDSRIIRDSSLDNRNGKSCDFNGIVNVDRYGADIELYDESSSPDRNYHRRYRSDYRDNEIAESPRDRRTAKKLKNFGTSVKLSGRYDHVNDDDDRVITDFRMDSCTTMTNGNSSSARTAGNGSSKQVKRHENETGERSATGSLTRERIRIDEPFPAIDPRIVKTTNNSFVEPNGRSNGRGRERTTKKPLSIDKTAENRAIGCGLRIIETIDDYGYPEQRGRRDDRSQSPIDDDEIGNANGDSSIRRSCGMGIREIESSEMFYSNDRTYDDREARSNDRRSARHAEARSFSPKNVNYDGMENGNCDDASSMRLERTDKRSKNVELRSVVRRSSKSHSNDRNDVSRDNDDVTNGFTETTNGNRDDNGHPKKYREIPTDEDHQTKKSHAKRKTHVKPSPEDFDVQIHRYERALRGPRRDTDLHRNSSFKDHESDLSRKSSFDDHQRSRDPNSARKPSNRRRDSDVTRRGSSEDRDREQFCGKSSLKNRDRETERKNISIGRNSFDRVVNDRDDPSTIGNRDSSDYSKRDRDSSITRRKTSSRTNNNNDDNDDHERSFDKQDRHSRPLTPPTIVKSGNRNDSKDRRARIDGLSNDRRHNDDDNDFARKFVNDHNDCRGKNYDELEMDINRERDRFSSASGRVVSTRSFNESRSDGAFAAAARGRRIDVADRKSSMRDYADEDGLREDARNSGFSTIERNGTTVIRIRTNSASPVGHGESRSRRRTGHRGETIGETRYRKYEDEAEDEDEDDDEIVEAGDRRDVSRRDHGIGPKILWNDRDGGVQITDLDDGQPCLHCGETCPGFSPHSWRKNCTSCKCPREAHDVCHEEWVSVRDRLGLKGEGPNSYVGFDPKDKGLTWAPPGLSAGKVEDYFSMLPEISVPRIGTPGERHRDRQLATQLPKQDLATAYCRHLDSQHSASADNFMALRNELSLDIGTVIEIFERGHECGFCHEPLKYGSLAVSAIKLGQRYHPSCFQCIQCRELLVDLAYCVHDDALYCERHYAEQLKPRCAACDELIFSGEYTKAMNKDWHSGHFCCWQCDESLTGQRYVLRDEHPYCIKCYESVFANGCEECNKIIGIDSKDLSYKDKHWHEACFLCNKCRVSLVDKQFGSKVDKIYCGNCYDAQFASRCDGCGEIFRAGTKKMEYKTRQWHEKCFCCVVCKNPIGTKSFIPREQEIYCAGCYEDKFATRCVKCNKIITSGGVTYKNEPWHRDCFTCSNCDNSLAGQRFTSRDDKPYCAECFGELFAKRCTACTKPITGIGGTRFISFEDRHWHNNCFICAGCQTSLVGRGFITDGDDIICPECAKQKLSE